MSDFEIGSTISSPTASYEIKELLGSGSIGEVYLCRKTPLNKKVSCGVWTWTPDGKTTNTSNMEESCEEYVALKVYKSNQSILLGTKESSILERLRDHGGDYHNIVRLLDSFEISGLYWLEFERLDISLRDYLNKSKQLSLMQIRPILKQLAVALNFLSSMGIIHGDIKPENIMFVDHKSSLQVKIIDFGLAHTKDEVTTGSIIQTCWYRAPEVFVGSWYSYSADVWSLGCIATEMLMGQVLFQGSCTADMMRHIVKTVGMPPAFVLSHGEYTQQLFKLHMEEEEPYYSFRAHERRAHFNPRTLDKLEGLYLLDRTIIEDYSDDKAIDYEYFVNLLCQMLDVNPESRISVEDMLQHPFFTMSHIQGVFNTEYVRQCVEMMDSPHRHQQQEEQPSTSRSCRSSARILTQQKGLKEQRGAHSKTSSRHKDRGKRDAKTKHVPVRRKKKVRFAMDSCKRRQSPPTAQSTLQREAPANLNSVFRPCLKKGPEQKTVSVDQASSGSETSGSRKRS